MEYEPRLIHADGGPHHILFMTKTPGANFDPGFWHGRAGRPGDGYRRDDELLRRDASCGAWHATTTTSAALIERARFYAAQVEVWWVLMGLEQDEPSLDVRAPDDGARLAARR